ncbi:50S ribosomal protein L29 [Thiospirochaeta perfilievii]|uniref:Large ribosomal subunit protein uL29 n=1 Tax=Thiospirochaeta perfilievii TaxID=252967 RepID=A0A5C1QEP0_9SPIO|nr:50S ribosomal protein L29 [Thiospirochaeta perfilievii]QEN05164.1 50S ribosomal protein L29 [Thiospirochaeta perfilievii]
MKKNTNLTLEECLAKKDELKKELQDLRFNMVLGHVENPVAKRNIRRDIARMNTVIREIELSIRKA